MRFEMIWYTVRSLKGERCLTDSLFFDSDCISSFLWVGKEWILTEMYAGRIVIPKPVYDELSYPRIAHLKVRVDELLARGEAQVEAICIDTMEYRQYVQLTTGIEKGRAIIGKGEAAAIVLARNRNGVVASNNLRDICFYMKEYGMCYITTGDILVEAFQHGMITEEQGNVIWKSMLARRRKIGASSFTDYLLGNVNRKSFCL